MEILAWGTKLGHACGDALGQVAPGWLPGPWLQASLAEDSGLLGLFWGRKESCSASPFPPPDGIHSVTAQCVLRVLIITEDMLANSITVRLENMWQERFLSPLLATFLEGVATVLATPKEDVFIFNIQNDTDVGGTVLNVSFSALAPRGGRYFSSEELQEQLYMKRMALTGASMLEVLPFDDNVCLREPCQNYMKCISVLKFDSSAPFIASPSTLFRPIHPIAGLRCRCPQGFTGDYCETEINLCYSNPCLHGGTCTRREGGYTCVCRQHFSGECRARGGGLGLADEVRPRSPSLLFPWCWMRRAEVAIEMQGGEVGMEGSRGSRGPLAEWEE